MKFHTREAFNAFTLERPRSVGALCLRMTRGSRALVDVGAPKHISKE